MAKQNRKITEEQQTNKQIRQIGWTIVYIAAVFLLGVGSNYLKEEWNKANETKPAGALYEQINPKQVVSSNSCRHFYGRPLRIVEFLRSYMKIRSGQ